MLATIKAKAAPSKSEGAAFVLGLCIATGIEVAVLMAFKPWMYQA